MAYPLSKASSSAGVNGHRERRLDLVVKCGSGIPRDARVLLDSVERVGVGLDGGRHFLRAFDFFELDDLN